jgi:hypothetical protein
MRHVDIGTSAVLFDPIIPTSPDRGIGLQHVLEAADKLIDVWIDLAARQKRQERAGRMINVGRTDMRKRRRH